MESSSLITAIAQRIAQVNCPGFAALFVALLRELAKGHPVSTDALAQLLGWPAHRVVSALRMEPGTEYDNKGNVTAHGISHRKTQHVFEVDDQRLYTWCALDALIFPALIGKTARVLSRCPQTGEPINLTATPNAVLDVEPADAVISLVTPGPPPDIRSSFCCHVYFFADASASDIWRSRHMGLQIVSVAEGFQIGRGIAQRVLEWEKLPAVA